MIIGGSMKIFKLIPLFVLMICTNAFSQTDLAGTWQGKLATSPNEKLTIQFVLTKQADGSYKAVVNSLESGIKNELANAVKYVNGKLTIDVAKLSGSYTGTLNKDVLTGEWRQQGSAAIPLTLVRYKKPDPSIYKPLLGLWGGKWKYTESITFTVYFRFEIAKDGTLLGFTNSPEQSPNELPLANISLEGNELSFKIPATNGDYTGKLVNNTILGEYTTGGQKWPINVTKGAKFSAPAVHINIPAEAMKKLLGRWKGNIGVVSLVFRFEKNASGKNVVLYDIPEQNQKDNLVLDASLVGDKLVLKMAGLEYSGKLAGNKIEGNLKVDPNNQNIPLTLIKE
jgi:hypothetical protein